MGEDFAVSLAIGIATSNGQELCTLDHCVILIDDEIAGDSADAPFNVGRGFPCKGGIFLRGVCKEEYGEKKK